MARFVLDEWLWADLWGEHGEGAQRESVRVLATLVERCDQLVAVSGSPFLRKFYRMAKDAPSGDPRRAIVKMFRTQFIENCDECHLLRDHELHPMPEELYAKIKPDDWYLVRSYLASGASLLVTTDHPLIRALSGYELRCWHRDRFVSWYTRGQDKA